MSANGPNGLDGQLEQAPRDSTGAVVESHGDGKRHLLLAATGSVATIKIFPIVNALSTRKNLSIRLLFTPSAVHFLQGQAAEQPSLADLSRFPNVDGIHVDASEWSPPWTRGSPVLHIELRKWADLMVIAPLSANSLAKMVAGMSDSLVLSVVRAWDTTGMVDRPGESRRKIVVAPAMNTCMWKHPITARQIKTLEEDWGGHDGWVEVMRPIEKSLACGDVGDGAMVSFDKIVSMIDDKLGLESA